MWTQEELLSNAERVVLVRHGGAEKILSGCKGTTAITANLNLNKYVLFHGCTTSENDSGSALLFHDENGTYHLVATHKGRAEIESDEVVTRVESEGAIRSNEFKVAIGLTPSRRKNMNEAYIDETLRRGVDPFDPLTYKYR